MDRFSQDWLSLGEASRALGVAPATLRRWSDSGRVRAFTTPGGHRRFSRSSIERLLPTERTVRPPLARAGMTPARLARAYRREVRGVQSDLPWVGTLSDAQRDWFRTHGRRMGELLLAHLDGDGRAAEESLTELTSEAAGYGGMAADLGLSLSQTVEGVLAFRRPFLHELASVARHRGFDTADTTELIEAAERAMDQLLIATMSAHAVTRVRTPNGKSKRSPE